MKLQQINTLPSSKAEEREYIKEAKEQILSGHIDPLLALSLLKRYESIINALTSDPDIDDYMIEQAYKHPKGVIELHNAEFQIRETGVRYIYGNCEDIKWIQMQAELAILKEKIKERETFLKGITSDTEVADTETGNILKPALKTSTTKVVCKLK